MVVKRRDPVIEQFRTLHKEELHHLYRALITVRVVKSSYSGGTYGSNEENRILVGKPPEKWHLGRLKKEMGRITL
jgi:hypothetical protein